MNQPGRAGISRYATPSREDAETEFNRVVAFSVVGEPLDLAARLEPRIQTAIAAYVVVLQVDRAELRVVPIQSVAIAVGLQEPLLRDPVELTVQRRGIGFQGREHGIPPLEDLSVLLGVVLPLDVLLRILEVFPLQLDGVDLAPVGEMAKWGRRLTSIFA